MGKLKLLIAEIIHRSRNFIELIFAIAIFIGFLFLIQWTIVTAGEIIFAVALFAVIIYVVFKD